MWTPGSWTILLMEAQLGLHPWTRRARRRCRPSHGRCWANSFLSVLPSSAPHRSVYLLHLAAVIALGTPGHPHLHNKLVPLLVRWWWDLGWGDSSRSFIVPVSHRHRAIGMLMSFIIFDFSSWSTSSSISSLVSSISRVYVGNHGMHLERWNAPAKKHPIDQELVSWTRGNPTWRHTTDQSTYGRKRTKQHTKKTDETRETQRTKEKPSSLLLLGIDKNSYFPNYQ
jgi:hypothetical protein